MTGMGDREVFDYEVTFSSESGTRPISGTVAGLGFLQQLFDPLMLRPYRLEDVVDREEDVLTAGEEAEVVALRFQSAEAPGVQCGNLHHARDGS